MVQIKTIGVIGLGSIGIRHAKNLVAMGHKVVGFDPDVLDAPFPVVWPIELHVLADIDAFVIASPTSEHANHLLAVGLTHKPCLLEKPVADTMIPNTGTALMVGYNLRFHSCVKKAKEWLDAGMIGTPLWSNFTLGQFSQKPPYLRDGVILNWSHEIDLCTYLLGPAKVAASSTRLINPDDDVKDAIIADDMADILLTHESGCRSTVHLDYITEPEQRGFSIVGAGAAIYVNLVERFARIETVNGRIEDFRGVDTWNDNYIEEMQAFIDRIDGKETIGCSGEEGLEVLKICLEVRKQAGLQ